MFRHEPNADDTIVMVTTWEEGEPSTPAAACLRPAWGLWEGVLTLHYA